MPDAVRKRQFSFPERFDLLSHLIRTKLSNLHSLTKREVREKAVPFNDLRLGFCRTSLFSIQEREKA
jgi:hypothetical protein